MIRITKITGKKKVIENIDKIKRDIDAWMGESLTKATGKLSENAIYNLQSKLGSGRWGPWVRGVDGNSIRNKDNWVPKRISNTSIELSCISDHAAVVELGGMGTAYVKSNKPYPIGKSQGYSDDEIKYRRGFEIQKGYGYLSKAINDPTVHTEIRHTIRDNLKRHMEI